ncbi:MAG TPA: amidohydrolase family protein [Acidimicrobiia bacterium]|nr:amidohydrolase family protein [Acidimicrobiia bacterium]
MPGRLQDARMEAHMERFVIFSADGHAGADIETYRPYLERRFWDDLDALRDENEEYLTVAGRAAHPTDEAMAVFDRRGAVAAAAEFGAWDVELRMRELDAEGIAGELIHYGTQCSTSPFFGHINRPCSPELRAAGARAYHRWLADFMGASGGRLFGVADPGPCVDLDETIAELRWVAEHGFVSVSLPGSVLDPALPSLHDAYFDPFYAACAELGLVVSVHAGWGQRQGGFFDLLEKLRQMSGTTLGDERSFEDTIELVNAMEMSDDSPLRLDLVTRRPLWLLMAGGVFDRHPGLRLALTEIRADWVPATLDQIDAHLAASEVALARSPREYYERHVVVAPSSIHRAEVEMRHEIGVDQLLFGVDYPHWEGIWPNTADWIRVAFSGVPEPEVRQILGENAIRAYGLDGAHLADVAARIGPAPDLLDGADVDEALVEHFHQRSGFNRPADPVDLDELGRALDADLALAHSGAGSNQR